LSGETHNTAQGKWNDCLPTSTVAVLKYLTGNRPYPDDFRDWAYGTEYSGYTFPIDAARWLEQMWNIPSEVVAIDAPQDVVSTALNKGWPVLTRTWERSGNYFHWCPMTIFGEAQIVRHNPLGGFREVLSRQDWLGRYAGYLLVVQQSR
jgi:hypothetical protein